MAAQQPGQHLLVNPGFGTRPVTRSLDPPGALPRRGNLPSPSQAHAEALGQLDQAALAVVIGLQKLLPQIIRIGSRHRHVRGESPSLLYTIGRNALAFRKSESFRLPSSVRFNLLTMELPMKVRLGCVVVGFLSLVFSVAAQTSGSSPTSAQVPPLIQFSSVATDEGGNSLSGVVSITFSLYNNQQGGEPLWTETQNNVQLDPTGHYSVQLGITKPNGVPTTLFTTGEARWLGVRIAEQAEQPRVLLLSVPYALKAGDAATIGGLPPSAFVLAVPAMDSVGSAATAFTGSAASPADAAPASGVTGSGTTDYVPLWTSASNIGNSVLFQSGTGKTAKVGINTITPASTLDVKGTATVRGLFSLPATGTATATTGKNSQAEQLTASAFNSGTGTAVTQNFQWQAEPVGNDS